MTHQYHRCMLIHGNITVNVQITAGKLINTVMFSSQWMDFRQTLNNILWDINTLDLNAVHMQRTCTASLLVQCLPCQCCRLTERKNMRCNHTVTYCLSQHSQEFMSPAIDLWHDAQDRGHGWLTLTSMLVKAVLASLKADQDSQQSRTRQLT